MFKVIPNVWKKKGGGRICNLNIVSQQDRWAIGE